MGMVLVMSVTTVQRLAMLARRIPTITIMGMHVIMVSIPTMMAFQTLLTIVQMLPMLTNLTQITMELETSVTMIRTMMVWRMVWTTVPSSPTQAKRTLILMVLGMCVKMTVMETLSLMLKMFVPVTNTSKPLTSGGSKLLVLGTILMVSHHLSGS